VREILPSVDPAEFEFRVTGPVVEWRGPAPYYFLRVSEEDSADIKLAARGIEYWGQVPVVVRLEDVEFTTALFPKHDCYLVPLKDAVRRPAGIDVDDVREILLHVGRR
jgi:hypothetical protein